MKQGILIPTIIALFLFGGFQAESQVIPSVPFAGAPGTSSVPTGWTMIDGSADLESLPTLPIWFSWTPDPGTLTGLPAGVDRIAHTHCLDHWGPSVIGGEAFGIEVTGLTVGESYSFETYTAGIHYSGGATAGDVHSSMWANTSIAAIEAMGDAPTQIGRDVEASPNWELETWTFTATATTMWIVLGCSSDNYRTYAHTGVLWAMVDPDLDTDCDNLTTTVSATEVCLGEEVTLEAVSVNGGTVTWDFGVVDGVPFAPPVGVTTYTATSDNPDDCTFSVDITVHDLPGVTAAADDDEICIGEMVTLTGAGADTYVWDGGVTDGVPFSPAATTTYTVTGTDVNGCVNTADITVTVNALPIIDAGIDQTICLGDMVTLSGAGAGIGGAYVWDGGITDGIPFSPAATTTYTVTGTDINGCENTDDVTVSINALPAIDAGADVAVCDGEAVSLSGTGAGIGGTYVWDGGITDGVDFTPAATTVYTVTGTDANSCEGTDDVTVTVNPIPAINAGSDVSVCVGDMVTLTGTGAGAGGTYAWSGGINQSVAFAPGATGTYTVTGTTAEGCTNTDDVTVTVNPLPTLFFSGDDLSGCEPHTVNFTATSDATSFSWDFGDGTTSAASDPSHTYTNPGLYTVSVTATSADGCVTTESFADYIEVVPKPIADFTYSPGQLDVNNTSVHFTNSSTNADSYTWEFGDGSATGYSEDIIHVFPTTGGASYTITLTAISAEGCQDVTEQTITIKDEPLYYIPNSFTPDGDEFNETFQPVFVSGIDIYDFHLIIFNRWGEVIFESYNPAYGWDGTYGDGALVQDGVYIWKIEFGETTNDIRHFDYGHINVIK